MFRFNTKRYENVDNTKRKALLFKTRKEAQTPKRNKKVKNGGSVALSFCSSWHIHVLIEVQLTSM